MAEADRPLPRTTRVRSLALSVAFAVGFAALYASAILTPQGQRWDAVSLGTFPELRGEQWFVLYDTRDWLPFVLLGLTAVAGVEALLRRRWGAVAAAGSLLALTALASRVAKDGALPRPDLGDFAYPYQTFPSGHTAVSLAAVVAIVWLGPKWLHPVLVVVLGAVVAFISLASLLSFAHRAADVIGGALLAGAIACAISAIAGARPRDRNGLRAAWSIVGLACIGAAGMLYAVALTTLASGAGDASGLVDAIGLTAFVGGGGVIVVVLADQHPLRPVGAR